MTYRAAIWVDVEDIREGLVFFMSDERLRTYGRIENLVSPRTTVIGSGDSVESIISDRAKTHGDFRDVARVSQEMKDVARSGPNWATMPAYVCEEVDMILHKLARVLCGDPLFLDHHDDIAGYATRVASIIRDQS